MQEATEAAFKKTENRTPHERYKDGLVFLETGDVSLFKNKDYQASIFIDINSSRIRRTKSVMDTGAASNLIQVDVFHRNQLDNIRQTGMPDIRGASHTKLEVSGAINLHRRIDRSDNRVNFGVVNELFAPILFWKDYIGNCIKSIHAAKRKMVPHHTLPVPI